ncbi:MAG: phenylacetate-CoA oxygenase subunit PaaC [Bacteroidetes bacterium]|nr:phenylacetate-CoA oxygenase subunit PaaC [Bacteroidota bacterium]
MNVNHALYNYSLRLADNNMILSQRLAAWCSRGPFLEEDLALTNISLDLLGQAEMLYEYAVTLSAKETSADELAFLRSERMYYNCLMVEQPNGDFAFTMVRQFLFSVFARHLYHHLCNSNNLMLQGFAAKAVKETNYHIRHSRDWIMRLGMGTEESNTRTQFALNQLWRYKDDMFAMNETDMQLVDLGLGISHEQLYPHWESDVNALIAEADLKIPDVINKIGGGYNGVHTEHLGHLLCEMQYLQRAYPGAQW